MINWVSSGNSEGLNRSLLEVSLKIFVASKSLPAWISFLWRCLAQQLCLPITKPLKDLYCSTRKFTKQSRRPSKRWGSNSELTKTFFLSLKLLRSSADLINGGTLEILNTQMRAYITRGSWSEMNLRWIMMRLNLMPTKSGIERLEREEF